MLRSTSTRLGVAFSAILFCLLAAAAFGQEPPGVVASFSGTLSYPAQEDPIGFEVDASRFQLNAQGGVDLVLLMSGVSGTQSPIDPGLISIEPNGSGSVQKNLRKPDTATSTASIALVTLTPGMYEITLRSEHKTTGAYRLEVLLAGDANGDFKVDAADLQAIAQLSATKAGDEGYSATADVDRNGVINGGDRQRAMANLGAAASAPAGEENPLEQNLPPGALALVGRSPETFSSTSGGLRFSLAGAAFDAETPGDFVLTINGSPVAASQLVIEPSLLTANVLLADGRNDISFKGYDTVGRPLYYQATLWAGNATLRVNLVNANGTAFTQQADVVAALSDDPAVTAQGITTTGTITFTSVPSRTVLVKAKGAGNEIGTAGVVGGLDSVITIKMAGFGAPSGVDNNDISLGTAGWVIAPGSPVAVVEHQEIISGFPAASAGEEALKAAPSSLASTALVDQDLLLGTSGEGERNLSRTFTTQEGTTAVKIRYRFITSEVPGGYFGTQFNDYFRVSLRTQAGGGAASETNSMNALGLGAFNGAGETNWREVTLPVDRAGDTIQADIAVANVADGLLDSQVVVDFVEEIRDQVRPALAWDNTAGGLRLTWEVLGDRALANDVTITVQFANGTGYANRLGSGVFTQVVRAGTAPGRGGPVNVPGSNLSDDPAGTTHIIAWSSPSMVGSIRDVRLAFGPNANAGAVSAGLRDIIKDGLRAAGAPVGTITSTVRTAADQARAMFQNLVRTGAAEQFRIYTAAGDAVIQVYVDETNGLTPAQIREQAARIQAAMVDEINAQGPENVSNHSGDPAVRSVVDLSYDSFTAGNRELFRTAVSGRVSRIIDEPRNNCFHLELLA